MITSLILKNCYYPEPDAEFLKWKSNIKAIRNNLDNVFDWKKVGTYSGPVRCLIGEKSHRFGLDIYKEVFPLIQQKDLVYIKNAGHWVHADNPADTISEISKFLEELDEKSKI